MDHGVLEYFKWLFYNAFGAAQPHWWFFAISFVIIASGIGTVIARNLLHAAFFLALCCIGVAGIFILLNAEFLAAVQVLVYAGGIVILIIFAIMLSESITGKNSITHNKQSITALGVSIMMGIVMVLILFYDQNGYFVGTTRWALTPDRIPFPTEPNSQLVGQSLMSTYTLAFWIASIVLTIAMIGALILSRREDDEKDDTVPEIKTDAICEPEIREENP